MTALYQLTQEWLSLFVDPDYVDPETGEIVDDAAFDAALDAIVATSQVKLVSCAKLVKSFDGEIAALKTEEERLRDRRKSIERSKERLRRYMLSHMTTTSLSRVKHALFTISIAKGREKVEVTDETALPGEFVNVVTTPDKKSIKEALKAKRMVPGARLVIGDPSLSIR
jgi:hypothetical protein